LSISQRKLETNSFGHLKIIEDIKNIPKTYFYQLHDDIYEVRVEMEVLFNEFLHSIMMTN